MIAVDGAPGFGAMSRVSSKLAAVQTPNVGGVSIKRHVLDLEAGSLAWITRRIGRRLSRWLRESPQMVQGFSHDWVDGKPITTPMIDEHGKPVMIPLLPDEPFRESYKLYSHSVLGLLKEQRERAKLTPKQGAVVIDDATFELELRELVATTIRSMPDAELRALIAEREVAPDPIEVVSKPVGPVDE